ncbi:hypothetical protein GCM10010313_13740 [Streptomyces violarus]|nr:hypothetical protein GCM10010313_13740 [Streptomyces violarus]
MLTGSTVQGHATPEHTASIPPSRLAQTPREPTYRATVRPAMTVSRTIKNQAQTMQGRITQELGRVTRNRRLQRRGRTDRVSGSLNQTLEKAEGAFRRNGSSPR